MVASADRMLAPGAVFVQLMKRNLGSIGISGLADAVAVEDGFRPPAPR